MKKQIVGVIVLLLSINAFTQEPLVGSNGSANRFITSSFTMVSKQLGETRVINVWTPTLDVKVEGVLPVMYLLDGGLKEDFPHVANSFAELIIAKKIPPFQLIGIENTQRRRDFTGYTENAKDKEIAPVVGGSEKFRAFIAEELIPEIHLRYGISPKKGIMGESLAGLFVMETLLLEPSLFNYYIAFDPSLWWNNHQLLNNFKVQAAQWPSSEKKCWFASSNTESIFTHTNELARFFAKQSLLNFSWNYSHEPKEEHHTIFAATKLKAITWTLGNR